MKKFAPNDNVVRDDPAPQLNPAYWDCQCENHFIQERRVPFCPLCNTSRDDMPDSRQNEVDTSDHFAVKLYPKYFKATHLDIVERLLAHGNSVIFAIGSLTSQEDIAPERGIIRDDLLGVSTVKLEPSESDGNSQLKVSSAHGHYPARFKSVNAESKVSIMNAFDRLIYSQVVYLPMYEMELTLHNVDHPNCEPHRTIVTGCNMPALVEQLDSAIIKILNAYCEESGTYKAETTFVLDGRKVFDDDARYFHYSPDYTGLDWEVVQNLLKEAKGDFFS